VIASALFDYLHLLSAGLGAGMLLVEHWLLRRPVDRVQARLLGLADLTWLLALIGSAATGLAKLNHFGLGPAYYLSNHLFLLKLGVLGIVVAVALVPTRQFIRWGREARLAPAFAPLSRDVERVRAVVSLELGLLALVPFLAVLAGQGYGA
jgi:putative membrane protein